ncbi:tyrosine-type recombinase/integrase [Altererythrobacter confluentis]|uniref:Tyrosine-type recombinase/integrase n=1 Tax=Allopontixanthobacter confluentis TaxID=1849021 RepID=A0A6L7GH93_9SPHN|nr:site-specific integrase [Allopontixanthobacter confluentis]MXP15319.1 tyrosine-type recombinase/integrase [Allopontixanthobacter confluentis]
MKLQKITPSRRKELKPGECIREGGIIVTKLENGDERWSLEFMYLGKRKKTLLGRKSEGWNGTKAVEARDQARSDIREGLDTQPKGRRVPMQLSELASWYLAEMEASGGKNLRRKKLQIERRLVPHLGDLIVDGITEEHIGRYKQDLIESGLAPATVNRDLATLRHVWSTAVRRRKLRRAPCAIPKLVEPEGRTVVLSDEQCDALIEAAKRDSHPYLWLFVEFGLNTAMRSAEIVSARFDHIDWGNRRLYLPRAKAGDRTQPLTNSLVEMLRAERESRPDPDGWIFPSSFTATGHVNEFNGPFKRAVKAAGLRADLITPHVMRHTAATMMVAAGMSLPAVQRVTGHKTLTMLMRYTHIADRTVDKTVSALDRSLRSRKAG